MMKFELADAPHLRPQRSVRDVMGLMLLALLPGVLASATFFGPGVLLQVVLATMFALVLEAAMLRLRGKPLQPFISDLSAPLTAVLFALCLPPLAPWWLAAIGMFAAIVIGKHLYGGLGHNLFNPAMVGYAVILACFPREFTHWLPPMGAESSLGSSGWFDSISTIITGQLPPPWGWDTLTQATPLDTTRNLAAQGLMLEDIHRQPLFGLLGGKGWEWIAACYSAGGIFLLWKKIIVWQVPAAVIASTLALSLPFWLFDPMQYASPMSQLLSGSLFLAAFFIATDPVSGCSTPRGRWLFGAGVALFTLVIRQWGAYPDGVAFAVLLMNCAAPLIDRLTRPKFYGEGQAHD